MERELTEKDREIAEKEEAIIVLRKEVEKHNRHSCPVLHDIGRPHDTTPRPHSYAIGEVIVEYDNAEPTVV